MAENPKTRSQIRGHLAPPNARRDLMGTRAGSDLFLVSDASGPRLKTRDALIETVLGSLARDDGRDLTEEFLEDRRRQAREKEW